MKYKMNKKSNQYKANELNKHFWKEEVQMPNKCMKNV
jgi:hypothetical protein